ncbi:MAG: hypothetical protein U0172_01495 [Nitrospiraceae bacterium]
MAADAPRMTPEEALVVFDLDPPVTPERVDERYQALRETWHPARAGNLTNHPKQFMKRYVTAEAKRQELDEAYRVLMAWLENRKR